MSRIQVKIFQSTFRVAARSSLQVHRKRGSKALMF